MKKRWKKGAWIFLFLLGMTVVCSCSSGQDITDIEGMREQELVQDSGLEESREEQRPAAETAETDLLEAGEGFSPEEQSAKNKSLFFEEAKRQKTGIKPAEELYERLFSDQIFQNGYMALTGLRIDDIDGNGQLDMLVMVMDAEKKAFYGSGCLWIYMNGDEPYCFKEEDCSFYGWFDVFWEDINNDENVEIVFSAQGTGCGAVGDSYKAVFKYRDHAIERMSLPSDLEEDYDCGLQVDLIQEPEIDRYSAYCPYFDEQIFFHAENIEGYPPSDKARITGANARGFFNLCIAEYDGKKVLQASEYLYGEGGTVHNVAIAQFLITWEKDGTPKVIKWWIEEDKTGWANNHGSRICYADGYYYYSSQLDHYYLYRVSEDGGQPECLAKVHAGNICVQDDEIYFINQSDGYGTICKMKTDGSGMEKLCEQGNSLQLSAEYIYFSSIYEAEYDKSGRIKEESQESDSALKMPYFLYRMKKDGSEKELIATDVWQYTLSQGAKYAGSVYCSKWVNNKIVIVRMDLNGRNEEEICRFDTSGRITAYENSIYYTGNFYGEREQVSQYHPGYGKITVSAVPAYTDCCFYKGYFYGLNEEICEDGRKVTIYRMDYGENEYKVLYEDSFSCQYPEGGYVSDIYASEKGIFFRKFVSPEKGCLWFSLIQNAETGQWTADEWEDAETTPVALPAENIEYGEIRSVVSMLESTEGYEAYLTDYLEYEDFYITEENEEKYNPYRVCLPQFNDRIPGYKKINRYFQEAYQTAVAEKKDFFDMLEENGRECAQNQPEPDQPGSDQSISNRLDASWYQSIGYNYIYIGEKYITAGIYEEGYFGGIRSWITLCPVTFDKQTGERVSLEDILGIPLQEAVANLTGSVYKYMEGIGRGTFFLKEDDILTKNYNPEQFVLFPEGIGIYYEQYAIDCGAAGDYIFVIPSAPPPEK